MTTQWIERYPRESVDFLPIDDAEVNGQPVTAFEVAITRPWERPTTWNAAVVLDGVPGVMTTGTLDLGRHKVWVRFTDAPEIPVREVGQFRIT